MKLMLFVTSIMLTAPCIIFTSEPPPSYSALAPAPQSMDPAETDRLIKENTFLKQQLEQLKNQKPSCCDTLGVKCSNVANRTDNCLHKRCSKPLSDAACQGNPSEEVVYKGVFNFVAAWTLYLPIEIACCPPYALCDAKSAKTCLCLDDED